MQNNSEQSAYIMIYHMIANDISVGIYKPGDAIPTQVELAKKYNVSRATISEAVKELVRRGLIKTKQGKGTFVISRPIEIGNFKRFEGFSTFKNQHRDRNLSSKIISIDNIPIPEKVALKLRTSKETYVTQITRVRYLDNAPISHETSYLLKSYLNGLDLTRENLETNSLYQVLKVKAGIEFNYSVDEVKAIFCPKSTAALLGINNNEPALLVSRVCGIDEEQLVEYVAIIERSDITYTKFQSMRGTDQQIAVPRQEGYIPDISRTIHDALKGSAIARWAFGCDVMRVEDAEPVQFIRTVLDNGKFDLQKIKDFEKNIKRRIVTPGEYLFSISPLAFVLDMTDADARKQLYRLMQNRFRDRAIAAGAAAYIAALSAAARNNVTAEEVMEAALAAIDYFEETENELQVSVRGRLEYALELAARSADWREMAVSYTTIIGRMDNLESVVPLIIGSLACLKADYLDDLKQCGAVLRSAATASLFGCLVGAFFSRVTFPQTEKTCFENEGNALNRVSIEFAKLCEAPDIFKKINEGELL